MHPLTTDLGEQILALIKVQSYSLLGAIQDNKTVLGGSAGSGGGVGDPPAGFVGQLTQSNITFDTAGSSRACSAGSAGSSSLVDNLDAIRLGLEICDDAIQERHIDWGTGSNQISAVDVPFATTSGSISATNVRDAIEEVFTHYLVVKDDVSDPPTDAELDTAFGQPATLGEGFVGIVDDNNAQTKVWLAVTGGSTWWYEELTKAV